MIELNKIYNEDSRDTLARLPDNSIDSIVTDPPYEFGFMGKKWDSSGIAFDVQMWSECLRVLKPGGYLLAFGGTRTSHRMVCAIEDAGFEIRDSILWLYGSGFPKNMDISKQIDKEAGLIRTKVIGKKIDVSTGKDQSVKQMKSGNDKNANDGYKRPWKSDDEICKDHLAIKAPVLKEAEQWEGWGTALKPAHEPICVARKPISEKTVAQNVLKYGTGGINIDATRIKSADGVPKFTHRKEKSVNCFGDGKNGNNRTGEIDTQTGRFPANVILDEFTGVILDQQAPDAGAFAPVKRGQPGKSKGVYGDFAEKGDDGDSFYDDKGGASRFFYIAKADSSERNAGLHQFERSKQNVHATVKPVKLIQYLQKLVTPPGGITYDPFGGSGTSAPAAQNNGFKWIMSELIKEHYDIAIKRIYNNGGLFL